MSANDLLETDFNPLAHAKSAAVESNPGKFDFGDPDRQVSSADLCQLLLALANQQIRVDSARRILVQEGCIRRLPPCGKLLDNEYDLFKLLDCEDRIDIQVSDITGFLARQGILWHEQETY